ncbi:uncharacterized protein EV420DRAFT_1483415 [Desarmillaria tabescens]|uniref:Uncharacterized protein n=1 Tax=Armillaria tabescens TaxID=1929756 RepID=A0AA39JT13_ARMTA|nr:uncharacterized protein EV420DRAFT_1483415 [Desarmillaria tabescens]KAK0448402.1 hypothetical protein EV420DRAFT_1483415 [Desarmillaria tabescens]
MIMPTGFSSLIASHEHHCTPSQEMRPPVLKLGNELARLRVPFTTCAAIVLRLRQTSTPPEDHHSIPILPSGFGAGSLLSVILHYSWARIHKGSGYRRRHIASSLRYKLYFTTFATWQIESREEVAHSTFVGSTLSPDVQWRARDEWEPSFFVPGTSR